MARRTERRKLQAPATAGASWMALVAAATLGSGQFDCIRARVSAQQGVGGGESEDGYRLIVQSYEPEAVSEEKLPRAYARPLGSTQRAVTGAELQRGVAVEVLHVGESAGVVVEPVVVAWVEPGRPNLEFDARQARPRQGAVYGAGRIRRAGSGEGAQVVLRRSVRGA